MQAMFASAPEIRDYYRDLRAVGAPLATSTDFERGLAYVLAAKEGSIDIPVDGTVGNRATETGALAVMQASVFQRLAIRPTRDAEEMQDAGEIMSLLAEEGLVSPQSPINTAFDGEVITRVNGLSAEARRAVFQRAHQERHNAISGPLLTSRISDPARGTARLAAGRLLTKLPGSSTDGAIDVPTLFRNQVF